MHDQFGDAIRQLAPSSNVSLKRIVERLGPLDCDRAARYVEDVALQLVEIHTSQRFHSDIRPGNIFLDRDGLACLGPQFRLSDEVDSAQDVVNEDWETVGDVADCLAPEKALNSTKIDGRADIYSLGCTLYFLLTGMPPFPKGSISERLLQHQTGMAQPIRTIRPDTPRLLATSVNG